MTDRGNENARQAAERRCKLLMLLATFLVATSFPVAAAITDWMDSLVLTFLRFVLAALLFLPIVIRRYGLFIPSSLDLLRYGVLSACLVGFFWAMFSALRMTSPLNTAAIFALTPAITALVSFFLLKEKLNKASQVALPIGVVGAVWVIFRGDFAAVQSLQLGLGDVIFFAGTLAMGCYGPLVKFFHRGEPMAQMTFWTLVTGAIWLLILSIPRFSTVVWSDVPLALYGGIVYLAVFTTLITFFLYQWSATVIGPTKVMSYTYLNPALVLAMGITLGDNLPSAAVIPGLLLTVTATLILQRVESGRSSSRRSSGTSKSLKVLT